MILLEIGNSTVKVAHLAPDGTIAVERYSNVEALFRRCEVSEEEILCAPVGAALSKLVVDRIAETGRLFVVEREALAGFIGDSYVTPQTLGLDRILNLRGLDGDGVAISCGTAITVDAVVQGRPRWGAILPGFRTAAEGLHARIPVLPLVPIDLAPAFPARTSLESVANGVLLGTALATQRLAARLVGLSGESLRVVLTGGDASILERLWENEGRPPAIDEALLFRGMLRAPRRAVD